MSVIQDFTRNVFQKNPVPGVDILLNLLVDQMLPSEAVKEFEHHGVSVSQRTIERHVKKIKKRVCGSIQKVNQPRPPTDLINAQTAALMKELREIENIDYSKIKDTNPVKILDKNMMKLELMLTRAIDTREVGAIIELQMKLADKLFKMRPVITDFNLNELLSKLDLTTSFIDSFNENNPESNIKVDWLNFLLENE